MKHTRHIFIILIISLLFQTLNQANKLFASSNNLSDKKIDRHALVTRHNVILTEPDPLTPLSVGNGQFAFTADITGLQSFPEYHQKGMALGTQSQWGWHSTLNTNNYRMSDVFVEYESAGRKVPYASDRSGNYSPAGTWLRANPHRLNLGQIGLVMKKSDGTEAGINDLRKTSQTLDLWNGLLSSQFEIEGSLVKVLTVCHPVHDTLAVRIESELLQKERLLVSLKFPYGSEQWGISADWTKPDSHTTQSSINNNKAQIARIIDADKYFVSMVCSQTGQIRTASQHEYEISIKDSDALEIIFSFSPVRIEGTLPDFQAVRSEASDYWQKFWSSGGAIDFSQCTDTRASELERRVVLSQYLTAIQCSGTMPPQETGLVTNSWFGKFHLEMHWWHAVHFALWDRLSLLERSLSWYQKILPAAQSTAKLQGYDGARWPKMTSPDGRDSPSTVGVFLIWQQPHPIYYAELCYRSHPDKQTLEKYREIVFETAKFMASYPVWDKSAKRYVLGPALIPAQESYGNYKRTAINPAFELAYWYWALDTAQKWRERLGMERDEQWDKIIKNISKPNIREGIYTGIETQPYTIYQDHPSMLCALGFLTQTPLIDTDIMKKTLDDVFAKWEFSSTWGWDYPVMAMTAARVGEPEKAIDALFLDTPKNKYLANGHNYQSARLPLYLPGNGGLLTAVAMMAAGWDGCPEKPSPGFPDNGKWKIRYEGFKKMP
ncbi:MAG: hypothetical protein JW787_05445 [Sedimentisphaerales bacterium]|nr:hypothetical protein [Sedimentisphaerales bacterium]